MCYVYEMVMVMVIHTSISQSFSFHKSNGLTNLKENVGQRKKNNPKGKEKKIRGRKESYQKLEFFMEINDFF